MDVCFGGGLPVLLAGDLNAKHVDSARVGGEPQDWLTRAAVQSLPRSAQQRTLVPRSRLRAREPRANKTTLAAGTLCPRGRGNIRGRISRSCSGRNCHPASAKWAAQSHSQGIGYVRTRRLPRDGTKAHVVSHIRPMSGMPVGTTPNTQVANASHPAGEHINRTAIYISRVNDTRAFLEWLQGSCPSNLTAQLKADILVVVPTTDDGFRDAVSALRSLDGKSGVTSHTYSLPEDGCVRLLIKNLGRKMPESVVLEELRSLEIHVQGVMQLRSGRRDQDPSKDHPPTPHFIVSMTRSPEVSKLRALTELCGQECQWRHSWHLRALPNASAFNASAIRSATAYTLLGASREMAINFQVIARPARRSLCAAFVGVTTQRNTGAV